jgi:hypothetical protein
VDGFPSGACRAEVRRVGWWALAEPALVSDQPADPANGVWDRVVASVARRVDAIEVVDRGKPPDLLGRAV